jgi:alpha-tubulin suppressor-like RCC1 family protein
VQVATGGAHSCALRDDGVVECWGSNAAGQAPATRTASVGFGFTTLTAGALHTCAAEDILIGTHAQGALECWGSNTYGQAPALVQGPTFGQLSGGGAHTCGIGGFTSPPALTCWGNNSVGQAGGTHTPTTGGGDSFVTISAGAAHTCAINQNHFVECWGNNSYGQAPAVRMPSP